jgi:hypothetical protein
VKDSRLTATAATIHRFQGSERDAVIFDLVDALPEDRPSRLTGSDVDLALRLVNVGLSRAKGKAIVLADVELIESRFGSGAPVRRLVELCEEHGTSISPSAADVVDAFAPGLVEWTDDWDAFEGRLLMDLRAAQDSVSLNVPSSVADVAELCAAVAEIASRGVSVSVKGSREVVRELEASPIDLSLLTRPGFFCCVDRRVVHLTGRDATICASVTGRSLPRLLEATVFGDAAGAGLPPVPRQLPAT